MIFHEFQAVILAGGRGSRMSEITTGKPKCLLPVGPKPLIWYPLIKLEKSGFTDAILIVIESQKSEIQSTLDKFELSIKIEYVSVDNEDSGTADSLRLISDRIKSDVILISCDLITDLNLKGVVDLFRKHDASISALFFNNSQFDNNLIVPGPKSKHKHEKDLIGIEEETSRLVFLSSASDFESELSLPKKLLKKHQKIKIHSNLHDSHVYILKNWVLKYLKSDDSFVSIKGDFLPHIIKKQLKKPLEITTNTGKESIVNVRDCRDIFEFAKESDFNLAIRETSSFNDHSGDLKEAYRGDCIRCYAYLAPKDAFVVRINTLQAYWTINNKIIDLWPKIVVNEELKLQHASAVKNSNQVDEKCIIFDGVKLHEKTSFKNSILGSNTEVLSYSRVFNSIVMNNVTIRERVALENCIVSDNVIIESNSKIANCLIGSNHVVAESSEHRNEVLTVSDRLMEF